MQVEPLARRRAAGTVVHGVDLRASTMAWSTQTAPFL
jgi:hypothetical protein